MARYASQPTLPAGTAPHFSGTFSRPFMPSIAAAAPPNPAAQVQPPQYSPATAAGVKTASNPLRRLRKFAMGMGAAPVPGPADIPPAPGGPTALPTPPPPAPPDPSMMGGMPPQGQPQGPSQAGMPAPQLPPAMDQPALPLPANPRMMPPRPMDSQDMLQQQSLGQLFADQQVSGIDTPREDLNDELMGLGAKTALDPDAVENLEALLESSRDAFDPYMPSWFRRDKSKRASQDNTQPRFSATGESKGLKFQYKADHHAQGLEAWQSLGEYFRGGEKHRPDPFQGKHAMDDWFACGGDERKYRETLAARRRRHKQADALHDVGIPLATTAGGALTSLGASEFDRAIQGRHESPDESSRRRRMMLLGGGATGGALGLAAVLAPKFLGKHASYGGEPMRVGTISSGPGSVTPPAQPQSGVPGSTADPVQRVVEPATAGIGKASALSDFAAGFLGYCHRAGWDRDQVKRAIDKVAAEFGADAASELRAGLEKQAGGFIDAARAGWGAVKSLGPQAAGAARKYMPQAVGKVQGILPKAPRFGATPGMHTTAGPAGRTATFGTRPAVTPFGPSKPWTGRGLAGNAAGSGGGALIGGFSGEDAEGSPAWDWQGAARGAVAFNPALRARLGRGGMRSQAAGALVGSERGALGGRFLGGQLDSLAGQAGYDTNLRDVGSAVGRFGGLAAGGSRMLGALPHGNPLRGYGAAHLFRGPGRAANEFSNEMMNTGWRAATYVPHAAANYVAGKGLPQFLPAATSGAQRAGRLMGGLGVGMAGLGYAKNQLGASVGQAVGDNLVQAMPQVTQHLADTADQYMSQRGMLDQSGQFNPLSGMFSGMSQHVLPYVDQALGAMGINAQAMSPAQKMLLVGGAGTAGLGGLLGSGGMAALGGGAALMGGLPPFLQALQARQQQQQQAQPQAAGAIQPRDEWAHQASGQNPLQRLGQNYQSYLTNQRGLSPEDATAASGTTGRLLAAGLATM